MARVNDVAAYILSKTGSITTWKLQKLLFYSQAWSLVWDERPLFQAKIEAWANGPVAPFVYRQHRGSFKVSKWPSGKPEALSADEAQTVDAVLKFYGHRPSQWLSDLTHAERPWKEARRGLAPGERGSEEITLEAMSEYYGALDP